MQRSEDTYARAHSIDMSQWRQEINTFVTEIQGELDQITDEVSTSLAHEESIGFVSPSKEIDQLHTKS